MTLNTTNQPVTLVISETVRPEFVDAYEEWVTGINQAVMQFEGFLGVEVIRPRSQAHLEYVVIVRFDAYPQLKAWQESKTCREWLMKSQHMYVRQTQHNQGLEMWFTLSDKAKLSQPAFYKMVIVGFLAVYPLVLLVDTLLGPFIQDLPYLIRIACSVTVISILITYPVMPWLTKKLESWLYPP